MTKVLPLPSAGSNRHDLAGMTQDQGRARASCQVAPDGAEQEPSEAAAPARSRDEQVGTLGQSPPAPGPGRPRARSVCTFAASRLLALVSRRHRALRAAPSASGTCLPGDRAFRRGAARVHAADRVAATRGRPRAGRPTGRASCVAPAQALGAPLSRVVDADDRSAHDPRSDAITSSSSDDGDAPARVEGPCPQATAGRS